MLLGFAAFWRSGDRDELSLSISNPTILNMERSNSYIMICRSLNPAPGMILLPRYLTMKHRSR